MRILLLLFLAALLGNHFEIPLIEYTRNPLCQESRNAEQRQGVSGEAIERPASELAAAFSVVPSVLWSPGLGARVGGV